MSSTETGGRGWSGRSKADLRGTRRGRANTLVGNIQEKTVMAEKNLHQGWAETPGPAEKSSQTSGNQNIQRIILEPEQVREKLSAVTNRTLKPEAEGGAGKTKTEAPESTRNFLDKIMSWRKMREEPEALAGRERVSSCQPASFLTRSRELNISEPDYHEICGTNTERASRSGERLREHQEHGKNWDQEKKNKEYEKLLEGRTE